MSSYVVLMAYFLVAVLGWQWSKMVGRWAIQYSEDTSSEGLTARVKNQWYSLSAAVLACLALHSGATVVEKIFFVCFFLWNWPAVLCDLRYLVLPRRVSVLVAVTGLGYMYSQGQIRDGLMAAGLVWFLLQCLYFLARGGMGGGDPWYAAALASWCTPGNALFMLWLSALGGGLWVLFLFLRGKYQRGLEIPYGPFLALAAWVMVVWKWQWWHWYG